MGSWLWHQLTLLCTTLHWSNKPEQCSTITRPPKAPSGRHGFGVLFFGVLNNSWYVVPVSSIAGIHRFRNSGVEVAVVLPSPLLVTYLQNLCFESLQIQVLWHWGSWCPVREQWGSYRSKVLGIAWSFCAVHAYRSQGKKKKKKNPDIDYCKEPELLLFYRKRKEYSGAPMSHWTFLGAWDLNEDSHGPGSIFSLTRSLTQVLDQLITEAWESC